MSLWPPMKSSTFRYSGGVAMSRSCLLVRHSDLRSSGRVICKHVMSIDPVDSSKRGAREASYVAENDALLDVERDIVEVSRLSPHL